MANKTIRTRNGNLFRVVERGRYFDVSQHKGGLFSHWADSGRTGSFKDAIDLVRAMSNSDIKEIADY